MTTTANSNARMSLLILAMAILGFCRYANGYDFWQFDAGRADFGQAGRYDLRGTEWGPQSNAKYYSFGQIGTFASGTLPTGLCNPTEDCNAWLTTAVNSVTSDWEKWGNFTFDVPLGSANTGKVRLAAIDLGGGDPSHGIGPTPADTAATPVGSLMDYATIRFNINAAMVWTKDLFTNVLKHELGHVLGLDDLYASSAPHSEEFVDHPANGPTNPAWYRPPVALQDNIMNTVNGIIDNDEIAGLTWLWGGKYNQIVTGDLKTAWNPAPFSDRDTDPHHGTDPNNGGLGWWDYRGTVVSPRAGGAFPYIDLQFAGYKDFFGNASGNAPWTHESLGNGIERFIIQQADWTGNFDLWVQSSFTQERYIDAWIQGAGLDEFVLAPNINGLAFAQDTNGNYMWATVFGPLPEPPSIPLVILCIAALVVSGKLSAYRHC